MFIRLMPLVVNRLDPLPFSLYLYFKIAVPVRDCLKLCNQLPIQCGGTRHRAAKPPCKPNR